MGSAWYYVLASGIYRAVERPYIAGGLGIIFGYMKAAIGGHHRYQNPEFRRYIRQFEWRQLLHGKQAALAFENARIRSRRASLEG